VALYLLGGLVSRLRIVIAGAGVAALEALLALRHLAGDRVEIDLVAPTAEFVYRPLTVLEPFGAGPAPRLSLGELVREHEAGHVFDAVDAVDPEGHRVRTRGGDELGYEALVIATGAHVDEALPGSLTFPGRASVERYGALLAELTRGEADRVVFAVPAESTWALPLYELALLTAEWAAEHAPRRVQLIVITSEGSPLAAFGERAASSVAELLAERGVEVRTRATPERVSPEGLVLVGGEVVAADRVVALPRLVGPAIERLPADGDGFVPVDEHGRVCGLEDVYAAGDATAWPVKQGGLAAQQADVVAEALAARAGASVRPTAYRPVLRGVLLTGDDPAYLRSDTRADRQRSIARLRPLWWPPAKVAGRHLAPYLAARGVSLPVPPS
jgi:sulfide:quinone oxidoreductase